MNIAKIYEIKSNLKTEVTFNTELTGWIVLLDDGLFIFQEDLPNEIKSALKVKILNLDIEFSLIDSLLPLGGGISLFFHKCRVNGKLHISEVPTIEINSLFVLERGQDEMQEVNISQEAIDKAKLAYPDYFSVDFFQLVGDYD